MPDEFTAEEKAYVESRGAEGPQVEETTQEPVAPAAEENKAVVLPVAAEQKPAEQQAEERVPVAAIQEERRRRKEAEKQAQEVRLQLERLTGRVEALQQPQQRAEQQQQTEEDPLARLERVEQENRQILQMQNVQAQHQALGNRFDAAVNQFKTEAPDVNQALEYLVRSRERELTEVHGIPAEQVKPILGQEMFQFLHNATQRGVDPARAAYQWAKERGYQAKAPEPSPSDMNDQARKDIARVAAGQQAARSLGQASGAPGGEITPDVIADMPLDEFRTFMAKTDRKALKALLGG